MASAANIVEREPATREQRIESAIARLERSGPFAQMLRSRDQAVREQSQREVRELVESVIDKDKTKPFQKPGVIRHSLAALWETAKTAGPTLAVSSATIVGMKYALRNVQVGPFNGGTAFGFTHDEATTNITLASAERTAVRNYLLNPPATLDAAQRAIITGETHTGGAVKTGAELEQALVRLEANTALQATLNGVRSQATAQAQTALNHNAEHPLEHSIVSSAPLMLISGAFSLLGIRGAWDRVKQKYALQAKIHELINAPEQPVARSSVAHGSEDDTDIQVPRVPTAKGRRQQPQLQTT